MSDLIVIKAKTKTGNIQDFAVAEIISIDGRPYQPASGVQELRDHLIHMDGRLSALEKLLGNSQSEGHSNG